MNRFEIDICIVPDEVVPEHPKIRYAPSVACGATPINGTSVVYCVCVIPVVFAAMTPATSVP